MVGAAPSRTRHHLSPWVTGPGRGPGARRLVFAYFLSAEVARFSFSLFRHLTRGLSSRAPPSSSEGFASSVHLNNRRFGNAGCVLAEPGAPAGCPRGRLATQGCVSREEPRAEHGGKRTRRGELTPSARPPEPQLRTAEASPGSAEVSSLLPGLCQEDDEEERKKERAREPQQIHVGPANDSLFNL